MDKELKCTECPETFLFTERDQEFYAEKGYQTPKRCMKCRENKKKRYPNDPPRPTYQSHESGDDYSNEDER